MPPFIRPRRGWDVFTPREIRHLPAAQRWQLTEAAWKEVQRNPWVGFAHALPWLIGLLSLSAAFLYSSRITSVNAGLVLPLSFLGALLAGLLPGLWFQRRAYRKAIHALLRSGGIRPAVCLECRYDVEGFEGSDCPVCGAVLCAAGNVGARADREQEGPRPRTAFAVRLLPALLVLSGHATMIILFVCCLPGLPRQTAVPVASLRPPPAQGSPFDIGPRLHEFGRPAQWECQSLALGETGFVAHAGPSTYQDKDNQDPDYYSVDVEKQEGDAWRVCFQRDFRIDELPEGFLSQPIAEIASYDPASGKVVFTIGMKRFEYRLPSS